MASHAHALRLRRIVKPRSLQLPPPRKTVKSPLKNGAKALKKSLAHTRNTKESVHSFSVCREAHLFSSACSGARLAVFETVGRVPPAAAVLCHLTTALLRHWQYEDTSCLMIYERKAENVRVSTLTHECTHIGSFILMSAFMSASVSGHQCERL